MIADDCMSASEYAVEITRALADGGLVLIHFHEMDEASLRVGGIFNYYTQGLSAASSFRVRPSEYPEIASSFQVESVPQLLSFRVGAEIKRATEIDEYIRLLKKLVPA